MTQQISDHERAEHARARNRQYGALWRQRANEYARSLGYEGYMAIIGALVREEVQLVRVNTSRSGKTDPK